MKNFSKRLVSWVLIFAMALSQPLTSFAEELPDVTQIEGEMLDNLPGDDNYVYMGAANVNLSEGDGIFSVPIYRTGNIDEKATITIRAISLTARYGKDYALVGSSKKGTLKETTLMELIAGVTGSGSDEDSDDDESGIKVRQYEFEYDDEEDATSSNAKSKKATNKATDSDATDENGDVLDGEVKNNLKEVGSYTIASETAKESLSLGKRLYTDLATDSDSEVSDSESGSVSAQLLSSSMETTASDSDSDLSPLAKIKQEQTGLPTRETSETEYHDANVTEQFMNAILPEYIKELPYACEQEISFEAGEDTAEVIFRTYDNFKVDGNKTFSLYIVDSDGVTPYQVTSTSVLIEDDEDGEAATLSFDTDSYEVSDNKVTVTINRENLENSMATAELVAYDMGTGAETQLGEVAFLPYETKKEVSLSLDHDVTLELKNLKAADEGEYATAHVTGAVSNADGIGVISVDDGSSDSEASSTNEMPSLKSSASSISSTGDSSSDDERSFNITISGKNYQVVYKKAIIENNNIKSAPVKGTIYDESYDPKLAVGDYYFSTPTQYGGMYDYTLRWNGDKPFGCGTLEEKYIDQKNADGDWHEAYGSMKYYHTTTFRTGTVWNTIPAGKSVITTYLYQYIAPDICSERATWGGQRTWFTLDDADKKMVARREKQGQFDRCIAVDDLAFRIKTGNDSEDLKSYDYIYPNAAARDGDWHTPLSYVRYYGFAAMYKYYEVNIHNPNETSFISGDSTVDAVPVQTEVASGADRLYDKGKKDVYVNDDEDKSNLVFTLRSNKVNNVDDIFCKLVGYTIKVGKDKNSGQVTVNYPEDFISFIQSDERKTTGLIDYSQSAKEKEIKKIQQYLNTVPLDRYFIDWIDYIQTNKGVKVTDKGKRGYTQALDFTPRVEYIDVDVKIAAPKLEDGGSLSGIAEFTNSALKEGTTKTYHAGDKLDLSVKSNSEKYTVVGYEVSTDGGVSFDLVRSTSELVLTPGHVKGYVIRPCVQQAKNFIEVKYNNNSSKKVHVANLVPQDALSKYSDLKGKYILDINPTASNIYDRIKPEPGKVYSIDVLVDDSSASSADKITRPTVTDKLSNTTYNTNKFYFTARNTVTDNKFYIDTEETAKSAIKDYKITGQVVMESDTIRHDGLGTRKVPIVGYTAFTEGEQKTATSTSGAKTDYIAASAYTVSEDATIALSGVKAAANDTITIAVDNGINDSQVATVKLGELKDGKYDIGQISITYPITAPSFNTIYYTYDNKAHTETIDLKDPTIKCYDDTLILTVEINPKGRNISCVKFIDQTITGNKSTYTATPKENADGSKSNCVFELKIPKMAEKMFNGDRLYAYIVDSDKKHVDGVGDLEIVYPTMDTGLSIYVENELVKPKNFDLESKSPNSVNLPIIGTPAGNVKSGVLSFTKTKHTDDKGYSVTVNMDFEFGDTPRSAKEKQDKRKKFSAQARRIGQEREYAAIQGNEAEQAEARQNLAQQIEANGRDAFDMDHPDMAHGADQAAQRQAGFTDTIWMADVYFLLDFEFVYDEKKDDYFLATTAITIGGNATISYTTYWVVGYVPVFLNFTGVGQIAATWGWASDNIKNLIAAGDFNDTEGNLKNLTDVDSTMTNIETTWIGKIAGGVGVYGCLGVRAFGKIEIDVDYIDTHNAFTDDKHGPWGLIIAASAGVGVDLIVTSMELEIIKAQMGFGRYEGQTSVSGIWDADQMSGTRPSSLSAARSGAESEEGELVAGDGDIQIRWTGTGTSDFSDFGDYDDDASVSTAIASLRGVPKLKEQQTLVSPAAEHTRPKMVQIKDDGTSLIVFLGASQVNSSETALYYVVGKGNTWSGPFAVDDDGTFDTTPTLLKISDDKVFIAWANARSSVTNDANADFRDKYTKFKISGAVLDLSSTIGEEGYSKNVFTLQDDAATYTDESKRFFNLSPQLNIIGDTVYCTYLKRDVTKADSDADVADAQKLYSTMAYVTCDLDGENVTSERMIPISDVYLEDGSTIKDPLVTDYKIQTFKLSEIKATESDETSSNATVSNADYVAALYTVDTDNNVDTSADRNIYLDLYDVTNKKNYNPIMISGTNKEYITEAGTDPVKETSNVAQTSPQLNLINQKLYATWIEDAKKFVLVDLSKTIKTLLATDGVSEFYTDLGSAAVTATKASASNATPANASSSNAARRTINSLSSGTKALLSLLKSRMLLGTIGLGLNISDSDQAWTYDSNTGWYTNNHKWYMTDYSDLSARLKSYYTSEYKTQGFMATDLSANLTEAFAQGMYEDTVFGQIADNDIPRYTIGVTDYDTAENISEYKLTTDGKDVYIFFTGTCKKPRHTGTEIYGMRFRNTPERTKAEVEEDEAQKDDGDTSDITSGKNKQSDSSAGGFTKPVMISSDDDANDDIIDEFDIFADTNQNVYAVANTFGVNFVDDGDGKKAESGAKTANKLTYFYFEPAGSVKVKDDEISFASEIEKGKLSDVHINVENQGLYEANGFNVTVDVLDSNGNRESSISLPYDLTLQPGESTFVKIPWQVPDSNLKDYKIRITTKEGGYDDEYTCTASIPVKPEVELEDAEVTYDGYYVTVKATAHNYGGADCDSMEFKLYSNDFGKETQIKSVKKSGGLKSGEDYEVEFTIVPTVDDFNDVGYMDLEIRAVEGDEELAYTYQTFTPNIPVVCEIEDGEKELKLKAGETKTLSVETAPWSRLAETPSFTSTDPEVAYVDADGTVHAVNKGTCYIVVYYPQLGLSNSIEVNVKRSSSSSSSGGSSGSSTGMHAATSDNSYSGGPGAGVVGNWSYDSISGKWSFTAGGRYYNSEWAYIYNPYATGTQERHDWFRFDENGNMLTGWYKDTDGSWYYLWPTSDNLLGHMVTGWQRIDGKWYYFNTISDGKRGAMLSNRWTPDGYYVGPDGAMPE